MVQVLSGSDQMKESAMGGVRRLWQGDLAQALRQALADAPTDDRRADDGAARGGRLLAASVAQQVLDAA